MHCSAAWVVDLDSDSTTVDSDSDLDSACFHWTRTRTRTCSLQLDSDLDSDSRAVDLDSDSDIAGLVTSLAGIVVAGAADRCGHQRAHNKTSDWQINLIADHIKQYPTMKSHYCRQSSHRLYLDSKLTTSLRVTSVTRHVVFTMYACDE